LKKAKKKKRKSNQSSVDFVIVGEEGEVKEIVKKKKKKRDSDEALATKDKKEKKKKKEKVTSETSTFEEKNQYSKSFDNPTGATRLFVGNLPWSVDDKGLQEVLGFDTFPIPHIKYITDKESKKFYGSVFVDLEDVDAAAKAVARSGIEFGGRIIKIAYAPPRPGDIWPPSEPKSQPRSRDRAPRPEGGTSRLFIGNVAYEASEDDVLRAIDKVLETSDAVKAVRWLTHKDSGEFRGSGFLDFTSVEDADKAISCFDGYELYSRRIRLDYA